MVKKKHSIPNTNEKYKKRIKQLEQEIEVLRLEGVKKDYTRYNNEDKADKWMQQGAYFLCCCYIGFWGLVLLIIVLMMLVH